MIFYFYGDNSFTVKQRIDAIKVQYRAKTGGDADLNVLDMSEASVSDLLNSLSVVPMFVSSRLFIVKDLSTHKLPKDKIESIISSIPDATNVIFTDASPDKRTVYFKTISSIKNAKEFRSLTPQKLVEWIKSYTGELGATIDNQSIQLLIDRVGSDQWVLSLELQKLSAASTEISQKEIEALVVPKLDYNAFALIDAILQKNLKKASSIYQSLVQQSEPDLKILGAITYQFRVLLLTKANSNSNAWQKNFGISPYAVTKAQSLVRNTSQETLQHAYLLIADTDVSLKSSFSESNGLMQELIYKLTTL